MKKRIFKTMSILTSVAILLSNVTGCGTQKVSNSNEPDTITFFNYVNAEYALEENPVLEEIEKKANVKLKIEAPPMNNYWERVSIVMASNELPDIMYLSANDNYQRYASEGLIIPLDDYVGKYDNIKKTVTEEHFQIFNVPSTGKFHAIPRVHRPNTWSGIIRTDWLKKVGLTVPNTKEEFLNVMQAFTEKDPDGNGENDTYGMSLRTINDLQDSFWTGLFGLRPLTIADENGKVTIHEAQKGYLEMLDFFRQMYSNRSLDPEFYLNKGNADMTKFEQSKSGFVAKWTKISDAYTISAITNIKKITPDANVDIVLPLKNEKGERNIFDIKSVMGGFAITNSCKNPDKVLKFINWGLSDEGLHLMNVGLKGITYDSYDENTRIRIMSEEQEQNSKKYLSTYQTFTVMKGDLPYISPVGEDRVENYTSDIGRFDKEVKYTTVKMDNSIQGYSNMKLENADIIKKRDEYASKYIMGMISKEELTSFINDQYIPKNQKIIDAAQKYYDENK